MYLSVIVPIYNVEKYLSRCIDSIRMQTFRDYELILVDDGSTNGCPQICDEYATTDNRIKVIHKKNGGLSDARNAGLKVAKGKYISFVDSDDFIIDIAYEVLISEMEKNNLDIITGNAICYFSEEKQIPKMKKRSFPNEIMSGIEFLKRSYLERAMVHTVTCNIYRRDLILDNKLMFKKGILHEDNLWTPQVFLKAERVMYYDIDFYLHFQREGSITKAKDKTKNGIDIIDTCYELAKIYQTVQDTQTRRILNDVLVSSYLRGVCIGRLTRKNYKNLIDKRFLLGKSLRLKNKIKTAIFLMSPELYVNLFGRLYS